MRERVKRHRQCLCEPRPDADDNDDVVKACHWGNCTEIRCLRCKGFRAGWGPVGCKCDGGCPRDVTHPGMRAHGYWDSDFTGFTPVHAAVKPSRGRRLTRRKGKLRVF